MEEKVLYPLTRAQDEIVALGDLLQSYDSLQLIAHADFRNDVDEELMRRAIVESVKRLPYCSVRATRGADGKFCQYMSSEPPAPVDTVNFTAEDEKRQDEIFREWNKLFFPTIEDIPLARFRLIRYADGHLGLYFVIQHLIMDGYSGIQTLKYVADVYMALCDGKELPAPAPEPWKIVEEDRAFSGSARWQKQRDGYLERYYATEPQFTSVNGLGAPEFVEGKRYGKRQQITQFVGDTIRHPLPGDFVSRVSDAAERLHVSPQILYMLAVRSYLGRVSGTDDVMVDGMLAARATLHEKRCGMNLANSHYLRTVIPESSSFADAVSVVYDAQSDAMRISKVVNRDVLNKVYERYETPKDCTYATTWLTYFPPIHLPEDKLNLDGYFVSQGLIPIPLYLMILPDSSRGTLCATYWYAVGYVEPENVKKLHSFLLKFLTKAAETPDRSLKELIDESL